jgi:hypothetical protein
MVPRQIAFILNTIQEGVQSRALVNTMMNIWNSVKRRVISSLASYHGMYTMQFVSSLFRKLNYLF